MPEGEPSSYSRTFANFFQLHNSGVDYTSVGMHQSYQPKEVFQEITIVPLYLSTLWTTDGFCTAIERIRDHIEGALYPSSQRLKPKKHDIRFAYRQQDNRAKLVFEGELKEGRVYIGKAAQTRTDMRPNISLLTLESLVQEEGFVVLPSDSRYTLH